MVLIDQMDMKINGLMFKARKKRLKKRPINTALKICKNVASKLFDNNMKIRRAESDNGTFDKIIY